MVFHLPSRSGSTKDRSRPSNTKSDRVLNHKHTAKNTTKRPNDPPRGGEKSTNSVIETMSITTANKISYDFLPEYAMTDFRKINNHDTSNPFQLRTTYNENDNKCENYSSNANLNGKIASRAIQIYKDPWFEEEHPEIFEIENWTHPKYLATTEYNNNGDQQVQIKENNTKTKENQNHGGGVHMPRKTSTGGYARTTTKTHHLETTYLKNNTERNEKSNRKESVLPSKRKHESSMSSNRESQLTKSSVAPRTPVSRRDSGRKLGAAEVESATLVR